MTSNSSTYRQQGVTLVFSLVILVTLTLIGITSIRTAQTELAMAGNQRESGLMFQAAEMGLIASENFIEATNSLADFDDTSKGLYTVLAQDPNYSGPNYYDPNDWVSFSQTANTSLNVYEQPRYLIEYMGNRSQNALALGTSTGGGYGGQVTGKITSIFRSTSRGAGLSGNSYRYIQSYYGKDAS